MNDNSRSPDGRPEPPPHGAEQPRQPQQVIGPLDALKEPTLAVDLAALDLDRAIATAHKFPRQIDTIVRKIEQMALYDEAAAERCIYMLPRAGKAIVGPSIGFANILANAWGNCRDRGEWIRTDRHEKVVVCEGVFLDLETNRTTYSPSVRRISNSSGQLYNPDMIAVTAQAGSSIGRRNAILNAVPAPLWRPTYEKALMIVRGTLETLADRRGKMVAAFAGFGVDPKRVFMALGVREEKEITLDHIIVLRGMFEALRDQSITPEEMFDPRKMVGAEFDKVENPMADDDETDETAGMGQAGGGQPQTAAQPTPAAQPQASTPAPQQQTGPKEPAPAATAGATEAPPPKRKAGRPSNAEKAAKAAAAAGEPAKPDAQPAGTDAQPQNQPAPQQQPQPAQQTAPAAQQPKPADPPPAEQPRNTAGYESHLKTWLAGCTSAGEVDDKWRQKSERDLRGNCGIIEDDFERMKKLKDNRVAELKKG
jgi:hypothetical protein